MAAMNFVDIIICLIFLSSVLVGFGRGFVRECISLITLVAAFLVACYFTAALANYFTSTQAVQSVINDASTAIGANTSQPISYAAYAISFGLLFAGTVILGSITSSIINIAFSTGILGFGNRMLGGIFGLARGYIINLVLIFIIQLTPIAEQPFWQSSYFVNAFQSQTQLVGSLVSPALSNIKNKLGSTVQDVGSQIQNLTN